MAPCPKKEVYDFHKAVALQQNYRITYKCEINNKRVDFASDSQHS